MTLPFPDFVNVSPEAQDDECRRAPLYKKKIALNSVLEKYEFTGSRVSYVRFVSSYSFFQQKPQKHIEEYGVLMST